MAGIGGFRPLAFIFDRFPRNNLNILVALAWIVLCPTLLAAQLNRASQTSSLVFNHVTVIDMKSARPKPDMTVVIQGNASLQSAKLPGPLFLKMLE